MKIVFDASSSMKVQASFKPRNGMGEFTLYFFSDAQGLEVTWGHGEDFFMVSLWKPESDRAEEMLHVRWEAETPEENQYFRGEVFCCDQKDSSKFLFVPNRSAGDKDPFTCVRHNVEE